MQTDTHSRVRWWRIIQQLTRNVIGSVGPTHQRVCRQHAIPPEFEKLFQDLFRLVWYAIGKATKVRELDEALASYLVNCVEVLEYFKMLVNLFLESNPPR
jgi:hypothetical protein